METVINWLKSLWMNWDRTVFTEKLCSETSVYDQRKNTVRVHKGEVRFQFTLCTVITAVLSVFLALAGGLLLWKKCVERRYLARLKKKYSLVRVRPSEEEGAQER